MKNLNESLLESIDSIEEIIVESELSVLASIGNGYAKIAMLMEYADDDVVNEFQIIQESVIMEAKRDKKEKKANDNEGKPKEGIITKLKQAWNVIKGFFASIGRWFKTKFENFMKKFRKNKQADPQTEQEIKSCQTEVNSISKSTSVEELKKINDHVKKLRGKFGDLKTVKRTKKDSSEKLQDEKNEMSIDDIDKLMDETDELIGDCDFDDSDIDLDSEEVKKMDEEDRKELTKKNLEIIKKISDNLEKIVKGLYLTYKNSISDGIITKIKYGSKGEELDQEFAKYSSSGIDRVKQHTQFNSEFDKRDFLILSPRFKTIIRTLSDYSKTAEISYVKTGIDDLRNPSSKFYYPMAVKNAEEYHNESVVDDLLKYLLGEPYLDAFNEKLPDDFEECAKLIQNEAAPLISQISADMIHYNMTLMKAYEEVAKRHGLIK